MAQQHPAGDRRGAEPVAHPVQRRVERRPARRVGLGSTLFRRFADEADRAGARTIRAITGPPNTRSIAFHTALGFTVSPTRPDYDGPGDHRVCFTLSL